jgi:hypothetical protein
MKTANMSRHPAYWCEVLIVALGVCILKASPLPVPRLATAIYGMTAQGHSIVRG